MKANDDTKNILMYRCNVCGELDTSPHDTGFMMICQDCANQYASLVIKEEKKMTPTEAIATLKAGWNPDTPEKYLQASDIADTISRKATPMKPKIHERYDVPACGNCGSDNITVDISTGWVYKNDYCPSCGQAIDWEEE